MNETDELYDRIHELAETSKELMGLPLLRGRGMAQPPF